MSSAACSRRRTTSSRSSPSTRARASPCASRRWSPSTPHATARSANRWGVPGSPQAAIPGSTRRSSATSERGTSSGGRATCGCRATIASSSLLRFHISHVLQVCSRYTADHDAGVPARGLNGEAYRGHVFWDELYVYPFLNFRLPEITRALLHVPLPAARRSPGRRARRRLPRRDVSRGRAAATARRRHRSSTSTRYRASGSRTSATTSGTSTRRSSTTSGSYYQATDDLDFLRDYGAEMMLEIARFWASIAHFNPDRDRYEIHGVMGPDEFHEKYPDAAEGGLRNNAYTNVMVAWICETARRGARPAAREPPRGAAGQARPHRRGDRDAGSEMSRKMFVPFHGDGIISQFEGYEELAELDWDAYRAQVRQHPAPRPDPARRGRRSRPLQAGQAGRHGHALLPVLRGRAAASCSSGSATSTGPTPPARTSTTTTRGPRTARR